MSYTEVDIYNFALGRIGVDRTVASLSELTKERRNCARFYPLCRDEVLERAPWPFAVKAQALALLGDNQDSTLLPGWAYNYDLPSDCSQLLEVVPASEVTEALGYYATTADCGPWNATRKGKHAFRQALNADASGRVVLSGLDDAYAVYVCRVTATAVYPAMFVSMLADRLAMEICLPMNADARWFGLCQQRYNAAFIDTASRQYEQVNDGPAPLAPALVARQ